MRRMFSENQIKAIVKYMASHDLSNENLNVASINANDAITAKTIAQSEANWNSNIETITFDAGIVNLNVSVSYLSFKVINGCLHLIGEIRLTNNTESSVNAYYGRTTFLPDLPDEVKEKIILDNGSTLKNHTGEGMITSIPVIMVKTYGSSTYIGTMGLLVNNERIYLYYRFPSIVNIASGDTYKLSFRCELDLI